MSEVETALEEIIEKEDASEEDQSVSQREKGRGENKTEKIHRT